MILQRISGGRGAIPGWKVKGLGELEEKNRRKAKGGLAPAVNLDVTKLYY